MEITNNNNGNITVQSVTQTDYEALLQEKTQLEALLAHKSEAYDLAQERYRKAYNDVANIRGVVRDHFKEALDGDKNATVEMDLDEINELLSDIGASEINFSFKANVTITFEIEGVEADDEEDAKDKILEAISFKIDSSLDYSNTSNEEYEVEDVEAE